MNDYLDDLDPEEVDALKAALSAKEEFSARPTEEYVAKLRRRLLEQTVPPTRQSVKLHRRFIGWLMVVAIAASVLFVLWPFRSTPAWASAIRLARQMPWIHIRVDRDGLPLGEWWVSPEKNLVAAKRPERLVFCDYKTGTFLSYDKHQRVVRRASEPPHLNLADSDASFSSLPHLFQKTEPIESLLPGAPVESWTSRKGILDGSPVYEYELIVRRLANSGPNRILLFAVDRGTSLPRSLSIFQAGSHRLTSTFDYPLIGPDDPALLGMPTAAPVKNAGDQQEIRAVATSLRETCQNFDDYEALIVASHHQQPRPLVMCDVKRILRRGNKWRVDNVTIVDPHLQLPRDPGSGVAAWRTNSGQLRYTPLAICDGKLVRLYEAVPDTGIHQQRAGVSTPLRPIPVTGDATDVASFSLIMPEYACRPNLSTKAGHLSFESVQTARGAGRALLQIRVLSATKLPDAVELETIWLDPAKDHVATRIIPTGQPFDRDAADGIRRVADSIVLDNFQRSPHGYWYPTSCIDKPSGASRPQFRRFYVDFSEPPSPNLFEATTPTPEDRH